MHSKLSHLNQSIRSIKADYKYVEQKEHGNVMLILKLKHFGFGMKPCLQNWIYGFGRYQYMVSNGVAKISTVGYQRASRNQNGKLNGIRGKHCLDRKDANCNTYQIDVGFPVQLECTNN